MEVSLSHNLVTTPRAAIVTWQRRAPKLRAHFERLVLPRGTQPLHIYKFIPLRSPFPVCGTEQRGDLTAPVDGPLGTGVWVCVGGGVWGVAPGVDSGPSAKGEINVSWEEFQYTQDKGGASVLGAAPLAPQPSLHVPACSTDNSA